jgi:very-short-patch-repair endonuclease
MVIHQVEVDPSSEISSRTNLAEARAILDTFLELRKDPRSSDKSIGILSFFNAQATLIRRVFQEANLEEEKDNYKISIIEGIQGDEKDIVLYSFVLRSSDDKKRYLPLTGEGGDIRSDINKGRVNVAFSRARLQTHCFLSMPASEIPDKIWIKKYIQYVKEVGEVKSRDSDVMSFDSYFEEECYALLRKTLGSQFKILNQVKSCGFRIDFVIVNTITGKQLAVECDGPTHFKDEVDEAYGIYVEDDEERQRVLEAAGWEFYRIKYSDWISTETGRHYAIQQIKTLISA